jgi:hypothetical protein
MRAMPLLATVSRRENAAMNIWKLSTFGLAVGLVAAIGIQAASAKRGPEDGSVRAADPCDAQPNMRAAVRSLNAAWDSLNRALSDKRGHRATAMGLVKSAIDEVQAGCMGGGGG